MVRGEAQGLQLDLGVWSSGQKPGLVWIGMWGSSEDRGWVEEILEDLGGQSKDFGFHPE